MKRILFLFSILFVTVLSVQAQPKISFDREKQDLGYLLWRNPMRLPIRAISLW